MSGVVHAFRHPGKAAQHLVHNPASALVPHHVRDSSGYRNIVRPTIKIGTGALEGFALGGPAGALIGAGAAAAGGGLTNNPFRPLPNLVGPAAAVLGAQGLAGALRTAGFDVPGLVPPSTIGGFGNPLEGLAIGARDLGGTFATNPASIFGGGADGSGGSGGTGSSGGFDLPGIGHVSLGQALAAAGLLESGLSSPSTQAGQPTDAQRQQAINEQLAISKGDLAQQLDALASDPNVQKQLATLDESVTRQVRAEMANEFFKATAQYGNLSGSAAQQMQNRIAATLAARLQEARQKFLLGLLGAQENARLNALGQISNIPLPPPQPSRGQQIGGVLLDLGSVLMGGKLKL